MRLGRLGLLVLLSARPSLAAPLSLKDAVAEGLRSHPSLIVAEAQRDAARARIGQAYAAYLPSASFNGLLRGDYADYAPVVVGTPTGGAGASPSSVWRGTARYSAALTLSQTFYDFGRTGWNVASARLSAGASAADARTAQATVEVNVVTAFFGLLAAHALEQVADDALRQADQHFQQADALYRIGTKPEIDVASADSQRAQSRLQKVHTHNQVAVARVTLAAAMGVADASAVDAGEAPFAPLPGEDASPEALLDEALLARPEWESLQKRAQAARADTRSTFGNYLPIFAGNSAITATGTDSGWGPFFDFSAQLTLSQPIFSGWMTTRQLAENRALERVAEGNLRALKESVRQAVSTSALNVREAREAVTAAMSAERLSEKQLALAQGRYQAGVGSIIELTDAQTGAVTARAQRVQAEYTLAMDRAILARALGRPIGR